MSLGNPITQCKETLTNIITILGKAFIDNNFMMIGPYIIIYIEFSEVMLLSF